MIEPIWQGAWFSDKGNFRKNNEDAAIVVPLGDEVDTRPAEAGTRPELDAESGFAACVCDGVGGENAGEVASAEAVTTFAEQVLAVATAESMSGFPNEQTQALFDCVNSTHERLLYAVERDRALDGMGSTLTGLWVLDDVASFAQVGDSRLYLFRKAHLYQVSQDQSLVGRLLREGKINEDKARRHPMRNIIDQVVGGSNATIQPEGGWFATLPGDILLMCSDGLTDSLDDEALQDVVREHQRTGAEAIAQALLNAALRWGGRDNVTVVVLKRGKADRWPSLGKILDNWQKSEREPPTVNRLTPETDTSG